MKVLVTGGAGFIGSNICKRLVKEGHDVRVIDNLSTGKLSNLDSIIDKIDFHNMDMGNFNRRPLFNGIDVVFHQGAMSSVPRSVATPDVTHYHCVDATFNALLMARDAGVKKFIYAASSSAYGDSPVLPLVETMKPNPKSPYAVAKLVGEYYCKVFYEVYGLKTISLRYFNVFGPHQSVDGGYAAVFPSFISGVLNGEPPTIYGDGEQTRDFTYIDDVVEANMMAMKSDNLKGGVINIAGGRQISVNSIAKDINDICGKNVEFVYEEARKGDVKHTRAKVDSAKGLIGFEASCDFREGLEKTVEWYKDNT